MTNVNVTNAGSNGPMTAELDEYTKSMQAYVAKQGRNRDKSPDFVWRELPSVSNATKLDVKKDNKPSSSKSAGQPRNTVHNTR